MWLLLRIWRGGSSKIAAKRSAIVNLIKDVQRDPFKGIGKPEPLKHGDYFTSRAIVAGSVAGGKHFSISQACALTLIGRE